MNKKAGGPAFPAVIASPHDFPPGADNLPLGMTLRDYFAAQLIAGRAWDADMSEQAERAYKLADAMLVERAKAGAA